MGGLITIFIYLGIAASIAAGAFAIRSHIEGVGEKRITDRWGAIITKCEKSSRDAPACEKEWSDAVAKNVTLQTDVGVLRTEREACTASVSKIAEAGQKLLDGKVTLMNAAITSARYKSIAAEAATQRAKAQQPAKTGVTCEQTLKAVDTSLDELAARRLRFNPPDPAAGGSQSPPADQNSGAGSVSIRR